MDNTYTRKALRVTQYLQDIGPPRFPDGYAALRHALFLTDVLLEGAHPGEPDAPLAGEGSGEPSDALTQSSLAEFAWRYALRAGQPLVAGVVNSLPRGERAALFQGVVRSQVAVDVELLLGQLGISNILDALVRDVLATQAATGLPADFTFLLRRTFDEMERRGKTRVLVTLLDIAAAHRVPMLEASRVRRLLRERDGCERLFLALLRYAGALRLSGLLETLHDLVDHGAERSLARRLALIEALVQIGDPVSQPVLERLAAHLGAESMAGPSRAVCQYLDTALAAARAAEAPSSPDGLVIAQFMFLGRIGRPGKGNSGGLGVFLASLGDALAEVPGIAQVYTLVLLNAAQAGDDPPLLVQRTPRHSVVHVPVCCSHEVTQYHMMIQESVIRAALERVLAIFCIRPDVFHIRYSDNGSRAAAQVARRMGKKVVFTITTDPHRTLAAAFAKPRLKGAQARALRFNLYRVYLADQLLDLADGLIAMPHSAGIAPLVAYFPQLVLDPEARAKPLRTIAEGIQVGANQPEGVMRQEGLLHGLCRYTTHQRGHRLDLEFRSRPIMLNVGRLHPIKQQPLLVQAWAESGLWRDYNLVLIGGDPEDATPIERKMQAQIEATFTHYPEARGRFCFLPAMPNDQVRRLERGIIRSLPAPLPHVYACSSVKEEFGIAVLEAMDAGFLVFGPQAGGLSSYIETGRNGFLMDTRTAASMAEALTGALRGDRFTGEQLWAIAAEGTRTVRERFDVRTTAAEFARFYQEIAGRGPGRD